MLVLADRYYCGFPLWSRAAATGANLLWRSKGNMRFPVVEALDEGSWRSVICSSGRDVSAKLILPQSAKEKILLCRSKTTQLCRSKKGRFGR